MQTETAADNTSTKGTSFPLFRLPGELRNKIYREYFNSVGTWDTARTNDRLHSLQPCLNIMHASHQLRSETASIFYQEYAGAPGGKLNTLTIPASNHYTWEITGNSKKSQLRRRQTRCR